MIKRFARKVPQRFDQPSPERGGRDARLCVPERNRQLLLGSILGTCRQISQKCQLYFLTCTPASLFDLCRRDRPRRTDGLTMEKANARAVWAPFNLAKVHARTDALLLKAIY